MIEIGEHPSRASSLGSNREVKEEGSGIFLGLAGDSVLS
jgi:hypothetical protein